VGGLAFAILGIGSPVFWGVMMAFFSFVPLLGTWVIWVPASIWLMVDGHLAKGIVLLALGALVIGSVDNFLRPWLLSGRAQLNALLVFIGVLGGISVFGMLGLVLGPIVIATAAGALQAYRQGESPG
jgi:predicted PurR-regulated permease PerM